jgi:hypothetical protein
MQDVSKSKWESGFLWVPVVVLLLRSREREERGFGERSVRDVLQFGIMPAERFRNFDFCAFEDADELQRVDDRFALEVIVGDNESVARMFRDGADPGDPGSEFSGVVEIVVAFVGRDGGVVGKPGVVAAAVETNVTDARGGLGRGRQGTADDGLINVAEACVVLTE